MVPACGWWTRAVLGQFENVMRFIEGTGAPAALWFGRFVFSW